MDKSKYQKIGLSAFLVLFFIGLILFHSNFNFKKPEDAKIGVKYEKAKVLKIIEDTQEPDPEFPERTIGMQIVEFKILTGEEAGKTITVNHYITRTEHMPVKIGTKMVLASYDDFATATVESYSREPIIYGFVLAFILLIVCLGGEKGLKSVFSLLFTLVCIIFLFIPMIIMGAQPILAAIVVVLLSTAVTFIFISGFTKKTLIAALSCVLCTCMAGMTAYLVGGLANISSFNTEEVEDLIFVAMKTPLQVHDLLFAGILIASLGALMDTAMSITSAIYEMKLLNPQLSKTQMLQSGMNVGRDIMGTMTNTLILAFTGSSINIFIIYYMYQLQYRQLINLDMILIQLIQGLSGSIALVLSIPISALLASHAFSKKEEWS